MTSHYMTQDFRKTEFYGMNTRRDDWGKPHNMQVQYAFPISTNPGDFPACVTKSSPHFLKAVQMDLPNSSTFSKTSTIGNRNSSTNLGGREKDAFLPSFRHTQRVRDIPPPVSLSLH